MGVAVSRIDGIDLDQRRGEQPVDVVHRRNETLTLSVVEPFEHRPSEGVAAAVEHCPFGRALLGEPCAADPSVAFARAHLDQGVGFQRAEQATEVSRVEIEPSAQPAYLAAVFADLPQQPRLSERSVASEVVVVEGADALGDGPIEPSHSPHQLLVNSSDFSQTFAGEPDSET